MTKDFRLRDSDATALFMIREIIESGSESGCEKVTATFEIKPTESLAMVLTYAVTATYRNNPITVGEAENIGG